MATRSPQRVYQSRQLSRDSQASSAVSNATTTCSATRCCTAARFHIPRRHLAFPALASAMISMVLLTSLANGETIEDYNPPNIIPSVHRDYSNTDFYRDMLKMHHHILVDGYKQHGTRNPKWDELAMEVLAELARQLTAYKAPNKFDPVVKDGHYFRQSLNKLMDLGCDDPLLVYFHAIYANNRDADHWQNIANHLDASGYHPFRAVDALWKLERYLPKGTRQRDEAGMKGVKRAAQAMFMKDNDAYTKRYMVYHYDLLSWDTERAVRYYKQLQNFPDPDPWVADLVRGKYHIKQAWKARGTGWGHEVKPEGWKGFGEHLALAGKYLTRAHCMHPDRPEAASLMIIVSGAGGPSQLNKLHWFRRAQAAHFDFEKPYNLMKWYLRPRWGGSLQEMIAFGEECLSSERYDTNVPWQYLEFMNVVRKERGGDFSFWEKPGVYDHFDKLFKGLRTAPNRKKDYDYLAGYHAVVAYRCGEFEASARILKELGDRPQPYSWAGDMDASPTVGPSEVFARVGQKSDQVINAIEAYEHGRYDKAADITENILEHLPDDDDGRLYVNHLHKRSQWAQTYISTGELDLMPHKQLIAWENMLGTWSIEDDGRLFGRPSRRGLQMQLKIPTGTRWRLSGEVDLSKIGRRDVANLELVAGYLHNEHIWLYVIRPKFNRVWFDTPNGSTHEVGMFKPRFEFAMERWDRGIAMFIDGQLYTAAITTIPARSLPLCIGGRYSDSGPRVWFDKLKLKRIDQQPNWIRQASKQ